MAVRIRRHLAQGPAGRALVVWRLCVARTSPACDVARQRVPRRGTTPSRHHRGARHRRHLLADRAHAHGRRRRVAGDDCVRVLTDAASARPRVGQRGSARRERVGDPSHDIVPRTPRERGVPELTDWQQNRPSTRSTGNRRAVQSRSARNWRTVRRTLRAATNAHVVARGAAIVAATADATNRSGLCETDFLNQGAMRHNQLRRLVQSRRHAQ